MAYSLGMEPSDVGSEQVGGGFGLYLSDRLCSRNKVSIPKLVS